MPQRIQRQRTKEWRMPAGAVYVGRPTKWGNPYCVGDESAFIGGDQVFNLDDEPLNHREVVELFRIALDRYVLPRITKEQIRAELAGRDLACWCPLDQPCHADVLLEIANGGDL
ncbi:DUF4326 domain-containing protein [Rhodococcus hoagii]|nr:DUF4326 domain-containing protein [Prescottella equi]